MNSFNNISLKPILFFGDFSNMFSVESYFRIVDFLFVVAVVVVVSVVVVDYRPPWVIGLSPISSEKRLEMARWVGSFVSMNRDGSASDLDDGSSSSLGTASSGTVGSGGLSTGSSTPSSSSS